jgi:C-terminal processing protease CtpA/Prc
MTMKKTLARITAAALAVSPLTTTAALAAGSSFEGLKQALARPAPDASAALTGLFDNNNAAGAVSAQQSLPSGRPISQNDIRQSMLQNLDFIQSAFAAQYGPGQWKETHEGWDLDAQIAAAKKQVEGTPGMTVAQYHDVLRRFFGSMKDFHVSVQFNSTEASSLPFTVSGAGGRYYITSIDRTKLSPTSFPFNVGDELVAFGGKPIAKVVAELQARLGGNTSVTERALAEMYLTSRNGAGFGDASKGPVSVSVLPRGSAQAQTRQLTWDYSPELISNPGGPRFSIAQAGPLASDSPAARIPSMLSPMAAAMSGPQASSNPFGLGNKKSFVPALGEKLWEAEDAAAFYSYLYKSPDGRTIGYVRIPSYEPDDANAAVAEFAGLMKLFQEKADGLVIDEVDNPGGSVPYLYALSSMLAVAPLSTPKHRVAITQDEVNGAIQLLKLEALVKNDEAAQKVLGKTLDGYPVDYTVWRNMADYSHFIIDQWNKGKTLTDPIGIEGVDAINPSSVATFTKPILILINELDFSGGDFFPAIMQDNHRATLFGTRTAGAGGFVNSVKFPNNVGVSGFSMTGSIAVRANHQPIENLGVTAEVQYAPSEADLQDGFKDYAKAVNKAVAKLVGGTAAR